MSSNFIGNASPRKDGSKAGNQNGLDSSFENYHETLSNNAIPIGAPVVTVSPRDENPYPAGGPNSSGANIDMSDLINVRESFLKR